MTTTKEKEARKKEIPEDPPRSVARDVLYAKLRTLTTPPVTKEARWAIDDLLDRLNDLGVAEDHGEEE